MPTFACTDPVARKSNVVSITVDADSIVRDETVRVEIEVDSEIMERTGWQEVERRSFRTDPRPIHWPIEFRLNSTRALAESYALIATAYDARGAVVARAQAIRTGTIASDSGLHVHFETQCYRQTMLCPEGNTCHRGACVSARDEAPHAEADAGSSVYVKPNNTREETSFAFVVALDSDMLVVAAPYESSTASGVDSTAVNNSGAKHSGAIYVFQ